MCDAYDLGISTRRDTVRQIEPMHRQLVYFLLPQNNSYLNVVTPRHLMFVTASLVTSRLVTSSVSFKELVIDTYSKNVSLIRRSVSGAREICGSVGEYVVKKNH